MNFISVLLALFPVLLVLVLLIWKRMAADMAGLIGWVAAIVVACSFFQMALHLSTV